MILSLFSKKVRRRSARVLMSGHQGTEPVTLESGLYLVSVLPSPKVMRKVHIVLRLYRNDWNWTGRVDLSHEMGWMAGEAWAPASGPYDLAWEFEEYPMSVQVLGSLVAHVEPIVRCAQCSEFVLEGPKRCPFCKNPYPSSQARLE